MGTLPEADEIPFAPFGDQPDPTEGIKGDHSEALYGDGDEYPDGDFDVASYGDIGDAERRRRQSRGEAVLATLVDEASSERSFAQLVTTTGAAVLTTIFSLRLATRVSLARRQVRDDL